MLAGILRGVLVALLLTTSASHLLAQQRDLGVGASEAREQRLALAGGESAGEAAQAENLFQYEGIHPLVLPYIGGYFGNSEMAAKHGVDDAKGRSRRGALQLVLAPETARSQKPAPREKEAQRRAPQTVFRDCAGCPEMVRIPPGEFTPGSANGEAGQLMYPEGAPRSVAITEGISIGKYEVTKAQFARFVKESGYSASGGCFVWNGKYEQDASKDWRNPGFVQTDNEPAVCVNWSDAKAYTEWLTGKSGKRYRLPSEAEWEYAARAGMQAYRPWGENEADACRYANVADTSTKRGLPGTVAWVFHRCNDKRAYTAPVGSYRPNAFGLYDTLGNAWEWTEDCLSKEEYAGAPAEAPDRANRECAQRVLRGGSWVDSPAFVSYDFRFVIGPNDRDFYIGFRVLRAD